MDGVSFSLHHGRTLGIVGESGSGKSVLSRTIIDILAHDGSVLYQGKVMFERRDLRQLSQKEMREVRGRVAYRRGGVGSVVGRLVDVDGADEVPSW